MSTDKQLLGDSLRRQTELSTSYAMDNGLTLIEDFRLQDIGVSAFKSANAATGALSRFLHAVTSGEIPAGSYLLVESLDRLSRDKVTSAMRLFLNIVEGGVSIVTLSDRQVYRAGATDFAQLIYSMAVMSRANEESQTKSLRLSSAWSNKRQGADKLKLTRMAPAWLSLADDRRSFSIVAGRGELIRQIFEKSAAGQGSNSITRELNVSGVPPFGRTDDWIESYVTKILQNRAVLGEFQPFHFVDGKRLPAGDAIIGYYPRIVEDDLFLRVQSARRTRATFGAGRKGVTVSNLFTHIATCAYCDSPMRMVNKGTGPKGGRYLRCSASVRASRCIASSWPYDKFETSFLLFAKEVDLASVLGATSHQVARTQLGYRATATQERLSELIKKRENTFELNITANTNYLSEKLATYGAEIMQAESELKQLNADLCSSEATAADPAEIQTQIDQLRAFAGAEAFDHRLRLSSQLRQMITSLTLAPGGKGPEFAKTRSMLEAIEPDEVYRAELLSVIEQRYTTPDANQPYFQVSFADGTSRRVVVDRDEPAKLLVEAVVDAEGNGRVIQDGQPDWHLNVPITDAEIEELLNAGSDANA